MFQSEMDIIDWSLVFAPTISIFLMIVMIVLMLFFYLKHDKFMIILLIYLFSLIIGIQSISISTFPLNPYFQLFFILFQTLILLYDALKTFR